MAFPINIIFGIHLSVNLSYYRAVCEMVVEKIKALWHEDYIEAILQILKIQAASELVKYCDNFYRILFLPAFDPEVCVTVQAKLSGVSYVSLITAQTNLWHYAHYLKMEEEGRWPDEHKPTEPEFWEEVREIDYLMMTNFLARMNELQPESISNFKRFTLDGMQVRGEYADNSGQHNSFFVVDPENGTEQFQFISTICTLATDTLREKKSKVILENLHS